MNRTTLPLNIGTSGGSNTYLGLPRIAFSALVLVGLVILVGIPTLYLISTYLPVKKEDDANEAVISDSETINTKDVTQVFFAGTAATAPLPQIAVEVPPINSDGDRAEVMQMRQIREEALGAARLTTKFVELQTRIEKLNTKKYQNNSEYDWLVKGVQKCDKWKIVTDGDQLSNTSKRSIEATLDPKVFSVKLWREKFDGRDWRKTVLAVPPPVSANIPAKATDDDLLKLYKVRDELKAVEERRYRKLLNARESGKTNIVSPPKLTVIQKHNRVSSKDKW